MKALGVTSIVVTFALGVAGIILTAVAQQGTAEGASGREWRIDSTTVTIEEILPDSGIVVISGPEGDTISLRLDKSVNLNAVEKGDQVMARYYRSRALEFRKPTAEDRRLPLTIVQKQKGPKGTDPLAGDLRQIKALVRVESVDMEKQVVTLEGPNGRTYDLEVPDKSMLSNVKPGDEMTAIFTEGVVVSLRKQ